MHNAALLDLQILHDLAPAFSTLRAMPEHVAASFRTIGIFNKALFVVIS